MEKLLTVKAILENRLRAIETRAGEVIDDSLVEAWAEGFKDLKEVYRILSESKIPHQKEGNLPEREMEHIRWEREMNELMDEVGAPYPPFNAAEDAQSGLKRSRQNKGMAERLVYKYSSQSDSVVTK